MAETAWSSITEERFEEAAEEAVTAGFEVLYGGKNELLLDFDGTANHLWESNYERLVRIAKIVKEEWWHSKSKKPERLHARITLDKELTVPERIALAACLGSDPVRELINLTRLKHGVDEPIRLFKPADARVFNSRLDLSLSGAFADNDDDLPF